MNRPTEHETKYYHQLQGATVLAVVFDQALPVLIVKFADGSEGAVSVWCDAEGNGEGFLDITKA